MRFSFVSALLCLAAVAANAQDVVTISTPEPVTRESAGAAKPGRLQVTRNGSTGDLLVSLDLQGSALPGPGGDFTVSANLSSFSVIDIGVLDDEGGTYTAVATVSIAAPPSGVTATATAIMGVNALSSISSGGLYALVPSIQLTHPTGGVAASVVPTLTYSTVVPPVPTAAGALNDGIYPGLVGTASVTGASAVGTISVAGGLATLTITDPASGYNIGDRVSFLATDADGATLEMIGTAAFAVTGAEIRSGGLGYTAPLVAVVPTRAVDDPLSGSNASLNFNMKVVDFTVTNGGSGYTSRPVVTLTGAVAPTSNANAAVEIVRGNITIPNGERTVEISVVPTSDLRIEQAETVTAAVVSSGSNYIVGPAFSSTVTIQDDDMSLAWSVVDETAQEEFSRGRPEESTYAMRFVPAAGVTDDPRSFSRYIRFQIDGGSATISEDYLYTIMWRHAGQPAGKTMQELRTTNFDFTAGWQVKGSFQRGATDIAYYLSSIGVVSPGDVIQFAEDNFNLYTVVSINSSVITITPPLVEGIGDLDMIRNNIGAIITENGESHGTYARDESGSFSGDYGIDITYTPLFDADVEGAETIRTGFWASNDYLIADPQVMDSIIGEDDLVADIAWTANAARPTVVGESGTTGSATITLSAPAPKDIIVSYRVQGTAVPGTDYNTLTGTITIPMGSDSVAIPIVPSVSATGLRTVILTLIDSLDYELLGSTTGDDNPSATVNIIDEIGTVSIVASDSSAGESDSDLAADKNPGEFTISIDRLTGMTGPVSVIYSVTGSATAGSDYARLTGNATIPDGMNSVTVPVTIIDDVEVEDTEDITINVESAAGYSVNNLQASAIVQIADDEPRLQVVITGQLAEPSTNASVTISYPTVALNRPITVNYVVSGNATVGSDYAGLPGIYTIPAGANFTTFPISVLDDLIAEGPESVTITISPDSAYGVDSAARTASVTITDNEPSLAVFEIADGSGAGAEPATAARVLVSLVDTNGAPALTPLATNVSFTFAVNDGTATFAADYTLTGSVVTGVGTIVAGMTSAQISIPVVDDSLPEGDEDGTVVLLPSSSYNLVSLLTSVPFAILDNEATVEIASTLNAAEPSTSGAVIVRNRGGIVTEALTVRYRIAGTARAGIDYVGLTGSVVIPVGSSQASIPVVPLNNSDVDGTRSVIVTIRPVATYSIAGAGTGTVNIADDDTPGGPGGSTDESSDSGSSCGAGSGVALLLGFASLAFLSRRRRPSER